MLYKVHPIICIMPMIPVEMKVFIPWSCTGRCSHPPRPSKLGSSQICINISPIGALSGVNQLVGVVDLWCGWLGHSSTLLGPRSMSFLANPCSFLFYPKGFFSGWSRDLWESSAFMNLSTLFMNSCKVEGVFMASVCMKSLSTRTPPNSKHDN